MKLFCRLLSALALNGLLWSQGNGNLQLHFMDVGQGDGALLISPNGSVVVFDAGMDLQVETCDKPVSYLDQLGITNFAAIFLSHFHTDHLGCIPDILQGRTLPGMVYDRGQSYHSKPYDNYACRPRETPHTSRRGEPQTGYRDERSDDYRPCPQRRWCENHKRE